MHILPGFERGQVGSPPASFLFNATYNSLRGWQACRADLPSLGGGGEGGQANGREDVSWWQGDQIVQAVLAGPQGCTALHNHSTRAVLRTFLGCGHLLPPSPPLPLLPCSVHPCMRTTTEWTCPQRSSCTTCMASRTGGITEGGCNVVWLVCFAQTHQMLFGSTRNIKMQSLGSKCLALRTTGSRVCS